MDARPFVPAATAHRKQRHGQIESGLDAEGVPAPAPPRVHYLVDPTFSLHGSISLTFFPSIGRTIQARTRTPKETRDPINIIAFSPPE
ncbi:MAG: hypothetical protein M1380_02580 [Chloroflexi bacterium]|nr:hypothetical protein [Chloroflexota bacterium]